MKLEPQFHFYVNCTRLLFKFYFCKELNLIIMQQSTHAHVSNYTKKGSSIYGLFLKGIGRQRIFEVTCFCSEFFLINMCSFCNYFKIFNIKVI